MTTKNKKLLSNCSFYLVATAIAFLISIPFFWMLSTSLKSNGILMSIPVQWFPKNPTFKAYQKLFEISNFVESIWNSFYLAILSTVIQVVSAAMAAFAFTKIRIKGREGLFKLYLTTMMIPFQVIFIPLFVIMSQLRLTNNLTALAMMHVFAPMAIFMLRQKMMTISDSFVEAATIDGATTFQIFWKIIFPLSSGTLATISIMGFMGSWNDYLFPLVMLSDQGKYTMPLILNALQGQFQGQYNLIMAGSLVSIIPILLVFIFMQRYFKSGLQMGGVKG